MELKICRDCGHQKQTGEFRLRTDGKYHWRESLCRPCETLRRRDHQKLNPERTREVARLSYSRHREERNIADRRRYYENPERRAYNIRRAQERAKILTVKAKTRAYIKWWRKTNQEKYKAQTAVGNALRDGKLAKKNCACGETKGVLGHHHDYSKPLDVIWMCRRCHGLEHRKGVPALLSAGGGGSQ